MGVDIALVWPAAMEALNGPTKKHQFGSRKIPGKVSNFCYAFSSRQHGLNILKTEEAPMFNDSKLSS